MGISTETIRKISIQGEGHDSLDTLADSIKGIDTRTKEFVTTSKAAATVTDMASKRQLSAAEAYRRQTLAVVDGARAQAQYASAVKTLDRAMAQGVVKTTAEYESRLNLLKQRYGEVGSASRSLTTVTTGLGRSVQAVSGLFGAFGV